MDLVFGTYRCPDHEPESLGVAEPTAQSYFGHMLYPFLPRRRGGSAAGGRSTKRASEDSRAVANLKLQPSLPASIAQQAFAGSTHKIVTVK